MLTFAILAHPVQKKEWTEKYSAENVRFNWLNDLDQFLAADADAYFDLLFSPTPGRINQLKHLLPKPVFIHSVIVPLTEIGHPFIRMNAWPGFLKTDVKEFVVSNETGKEQLHWICSQLQWEYRLVQDVPGLVAPRVIGMIINEAFFAVESGVSGKEEIDLAMKLGTNYPMGPFQWAEYIGIENIYDLLKTLSVNDALYRPSDLLKVEATGKPM